MQNQWQQWVKQRLTTSATEPESQYYDLTHYGVISFKGEDSKRFLQGQITADIEQVTQNQARLTATCTPQGRMRSLFVLVALADDHFLGLLPNELVQPTLETLTKFAVFYKTTLEDVTEQWAILGSKCEASEPLQVTHEGKHISISWYDNRQIQVFPAENAVKFAEEFEHQILPFDKWQIEDICAGIPRLFTSTVDVFLPHNLNLPELSAVSFNKGCYTGQEVVARMHYKGKLKSHMRLLLGKDDRCPEPGSTVIADDKKLGEVICAASDGQTLYILALCKDVIESATKIQCELENAPILELRNF